MNFKLSPLCVGLEHFLWCHPDTVAQIIRAIFLLQSLKQNRHIVALNVWQYKFWRPSCRGMMGGRGIGGYHVVKWRGGLTVHMFRDTGMYSVYTYTLARGWSTRLITADNCASSSLFMCLICFHPCPSFACGVLGRERGVSVRQQHRDHSADDQHRNHRCNVTAGAHSWEGEDISFRQCYVKLNKCTFI